MESKICPWCTGPVAPKPGRGRPPVYCSDQCRRYAYEHRRAAQRESQPVRIIVEKTPPQVIERTRRAWSRPDPNALAEALEEHPDLAAPVLRRMVELATNERLSNRARTALGAHLARFTAELFTARFAFNPRPATTTGRVITAEQWGIWPQQPDRSRPPNAPSTPGNEPSPPARNGYGNGRTISTSAPRTSPTATPRPAPTRNKPAGSATNSTISKPRPANIPPTREAASTAPPDRLRRAPPGHPSTPRTDPPTATTPPHQAPAQPHGSTTKTPSGHITGGGSGAHP